MVEEAERAVEVGLSYGEEPRLLLRAALFQLARGDRSAAIALFRRASEKGEPTAMGNYAQLLLEAGKREEALTWGRRAAKAGPMMVHARRSHGMAALASGHTDEALQAFNAALVLDSSPTNKYNVALAMMELGQTSTAIPLFEACLQDPRIGPLARAKLAAIRAAPR
jgi:tetratricopeptide (TPR) repeat protein